MITMEEIKERRKEYGHISNHPVLKDVDWLIQRVNDLELTRNKAERCSCVFEEDGETLLRWCDAHAVWRDRAREAETRMMELKGQNELLQKDKRVLDGLFMKYHARVGELEVEKAELENGIKKHLSLGTAKDGSQAPFLGET